MKFLLALLIASQAFLLINGREFVFGDENLGPGWRHSIEGRVTLPAQVGVTHNIVQNFTADGNIWTVRCVNIGPGMVGLPEPTCQLNAGGRWHHEVSLRFVHTVANQPIDFRVEVYAGVGMAKASMFFLAFALLISYLMK